MIGKCRESGGDYQTERWPLCFRLFATAGEPPALRLCQQPSHGSAQPREIATVIGPSKNYSKLLRGYLAVVVLDLGS
jgi:hypothetical protein